MGSGASFRLRLPKPRACEEHLKRVGGGTCRLLSPLTPPPPSFTFIPSLSLMGSPLPPCSEACCGLAANYGLPSASPSLRSPPPFLSPECSDHFSLPPTRRSHWDSSHPEPACFSHLSTRAESVLAGLSSLQPDSSAALLDRDMHQFFSGYGKLQTSCISTNLSSQ